MLPSHFSPDSLYQQLPVSLNEEARPLEAITFTTVDLLEDTIAYISDKYMHFSKNELFYFSACQLMPLLQNIFCKYHMNANALNI